MKCLLCLRERADGQTLVATIPIAAGDDVKQESKPESCFDHHSAYLIGVRGACFLEYQRRRHLLFSRHVAAGAASLALFWLLAMTSGDDRVAATEP